MTVYMHACIQHNSNCYCYRPRHVTWLCYLIFICCAGGSVSARCGRGYWWVDENMGWGQLMHFSMELMQRRFDRVIGFNSYETFTRKWLHSLHVWPLYPFLPFGFCTPRGVCPVRMRALLLLNDILNYIQLLSYLAPYIVDRVTVKVNGHLVKGQSPPSSHSMKLNAEGTAAQVKHSQSNIWQEIFLEKSWWAQQPKRHKRILLQKCMGTWSIHLWPRWPCRTSSGVNVALAVTVHL